MKIKQKLDYYYFSQYIWKIYPEMRNSINQIL